MYPQGNIVQSLMYAQGWNTDTLQSKKWLYDTGKQTSAFAYQQT